MRGFRGFRMCDMDWRGAREPSHTLGELIEELVPAGVTCENKSEAPLTFTDLLKNPKLSPQTNEEKAFRHILHETSRQIFREMMDEGIGAPGIGIEQAIQDFPNQLLGMPLNDHPINSWQIEQILRMCDSSEKIYQLMHVVYFEKPTQYSLNLRFCSRIDMEENERDKEND
jgi:hypothetical protein